MAGEDYTRRLQEYERIIESLPEDQQARLRGLLEETKQRHVQIGVSVGRALRALDDWRLEQKYQLFDREARFREAREEKGGNGS